MKRITTTLILLLSVYMLPWWLTFFAVCVCFFFFDIFVEGVVVALILDWLYSPSFYYFPSYHPAPVIALILCIFVPIIKKRLLFK
jgi:hypothetical protein